MDDAAAELEAEVSRAAAALAVIFLIRVEVVSRSTGLRECRTGRCAAANSSRPGGVYGNGYCGSSGSVGQPRPASPSVSPPTGGGFVQQQQPGAVNFFAAGELDQVDEISAMLQGGAAPRQ